MYYAGIDAHSQYGHVTVLDKDGSVVIDGRVSLDEEGALERVLAPCRPLRVVVETCPFWPALRDRLEAVDVRFTLAHSRELRAIAQHAQKNDAVDAGLLARMLLSELIPPAHAHATAELEQLRLVRHHAWLTRYRTMCANRIHAQLHQSGIRLAREQLLRPKAVRELRRLGPRLTREQRRLVRSHLLLIRQLHAMLRVLRHEVRRQAAQSARARLLQTVPGIGPYWSLLLSAELIPIERFRSADHLVSYSGLAPITRRSSDHVRHGPLPRAANRWVRGALVAATISHLRHAPNSRLTHYYERTKARLGWQKARVATARKLARIVFHMMRSQQPWRDEIPADRDSERTLQDVTANNL